MTTSISTSPVDFIERELQAVRATSARWLEAVQDRDPQRVAAFYSDNGGFFVPNAPPAHGREAVAAMWSQLLSVTSLSLRWTPDQVDVARAGDLAFETGAYQLAMDGPAGHVEDDGKYVVVWRKRVGEWEVVTDIFNSNRPISAPS